MARRDINKMPYHFDGSIVSIEYNAMGKPEKLIDKEGREWRSKGFRIRGS